MKYVIGLGKTGAALSNYLAKYQIPFVVWDDTPVLQQKAQNLGYDLVAPEGASWEMIEEVILSPGIPTTFPKPHRVVELARKHKVAFCGDVDFWSRTFQILNFKFVGITGTNGKSTTHSIIDYVLKTQGFPCFSGGNSGIPLFDATELKPDTIINLEISSYQLDILYQMRFDVGVLLNITPDHLDRHGNLENYIAAKKKQIEFTKNDGLKVVGVDTPSSEKAYVDLIREGHKNIIPISASKKLVQGVYAEGENVYTIANGQEVFLGKVPDVLPGAHNAQNIMAAMLVCGFFGVATEEFFKIIQTYPGLEHRQENVLDIEKALFINDSKATNADATLPALKTYSNIYWIVGGIAKAEGVIPLLPYLQNIEKILLIGESSVRFKNELKDVKQAVYISKTLEKALEMIKKDLSVNQHKITVLLSPACASQDQFQNFEHRGIVFKQLVKKYFGEQ